MSADDETRTRTDTTRYYRHIPSVLRLPISPHQPNWLQGWEVRRKASSWLCFSSPLALQHPLLNRLKSGPQAAFLSPFALPKGVAIIGVNSPNLKAVAFKQFIDGNELATDALDMPCAKRRGDGIGAKPLVFAALDSLQKANRQGFGALLFFSYMFALKCVHLMEYRKIFFSQWGWHFLREAATHLPQLAYNITHFPSRNLNFQAVEKNF